MNKLKGITACILLLFAGACASGPAGVVEEACDAARSGDDEAYWSHFSKDVRDAIESFEEMGKGRTSSSQGKLDQCQVGESSMEGDTAVVTLEGESDVDALLLREESGEWKIFGLRKGGRDVNLAKILKATSNMLKGMSDSMEAVQQETGKAMDEAAKGMEEAAKGMEDAMKQLQEKMGESGRNGE